MRSHARLRRAALCRAAPALLIALLVSLLGRVPVARAATFDLTVCDPNPLINGAALVAALTTANSNGAADTIVLGASCTYALNSVNNTLDGPTGLPVIVRDGDPAFGLTIEGNGATIERAAGSPPFRLLYIDGTAFNPIPVTLNNLTLRGGDPDTDYGGAIVARYTNLTITNSTFSDNVTGDDGGAIFSMDADGRISGSTFSGNSAARGGAIFFGADGGGSFAVDNSTFSGNSATEGGAILSRAELALAHVTIASNGDTSLVSDGSTIISNSIVVGGGGSLPDTSGFVTSAGYNLIGMDDAGVFVEPGDSAGAPGAPLASGLAPLGDNGGPTLTHALLAGSPALDAIPAGTNGCGGDFATDQRGVARPAGAACDIGAFEGAAAPPAAPEIAIFLGASSAAGTPLADGQAAPVDFGSTAVGAAVDRIFTIQNVGTADLAISPPALPAGFALVGPFPAGPLAPNAEASFQVRLTAAAAGSFAGSLSLTNGDADESPFDLALQGTVIAPPAPGHRAFLPLLAAARPQPDLVVTSLSVSPDKRAFAAGEPVVVSVVVTNRGTGHAPPFWVDLSVSPRRPPETNDLWHDICGLSPCVGAAWGVSSGLAPGQSVTLTTVEGFDPQRTYWTGWLPSGAITLYAYADSWNSLGSAGAVQESDETNNRGSLSGLTVTGPNPPAQPWPGAGLAETPDVPGLPARPGLE